MIQILNFQILTFQIWNNPRNPSVEPLWNPSVEPLWNPCGTLKETPTMKTQVSCIILGNLLRSSRLCSYPSRQNTPNFRKDCTPRISDYMSKLMFIKCIPVEQTKYSNRLVRNHHFINSGTPLEPARKNQLRRRKSPASSLETCSAAVACAASPPGKTRNVFLH